LGSLATSVSICPLAQTRVARATRGLRCMPSNMQRVARSPYRGSGRAPAQPINAPGARYPSGWSNRTWLCVALKLSASLGPPRGLRRVSLGFPIASPHRSPLLSVQRAFNAPLTRGSRKSMQAYQYYVGVALLAEHRVAPVPVCRSAQRPVAKAVRITGSGPTLDPSLKPASPWRSLDNGPIEILYPFSASTPRMVRRRCSGV
jgi:hypothetical protein